MSHAPTHAPAHPPENPAPSGGGIHPAPAWIPSAIVALCVILAIVAMARGCASNQNSQATVVYRESKAPEYTTYLFGPDGCVSKHLAKARWSPIDKAIKVCDPSGDCHTEVIGGNYPTSSFRPATWKFCKQDPAATGVVIWED